METGQIMQETERQGEREVVLKEINAECRMSRRGYRG